MQFDIEYISGTCELEDLTKEELSVLFEQMRRDGIGLGLDPVRYHSRKFKSLDEGWKYCQAMFSSVVAAKESEVAFNNEEKPKMTKKSKVTVDPNAIITIMVDKNPKKRTAAERFSHYVDGMTVQQYCDAVGEKFGIPDIIWDMEHGWISLQEGGTHGSVDLDDDADKLVYLGQDPGPTIEDLGI